MPLTAASWANMKPEAIVTMLANFPYMAFSVHRPTIGVAAVLLQYRREVNKVVTYNLVKN